MKRIFLLLPLILLLFAQIPVRSENVQFTAANFKIEVLDGNRDSSLMRLTVTDGPTLPSGITYLLELNSGEEEFEFADSVVFETNRNLVSAARVVNVSINSDTERFELYDHEVDSFVWNHVGHVMANWTFGDIPPDGRGFGQGAKADVGLLEENIPSSPNLTEAKAFSESLINVLLGGSPVDLDGDASTLQISDGYGLILYSLGMRDHIFNAAVSGDNGTYFIDEFYSVLDTFPDHIDVEGFTNFIQNLNSSETTLALVYQSAVSILELTDVNGLNNMFSNLGNNLTIFSTFIFDTYNTVQELTTTHEFTIGEISLEFEDDATTTSEEDTDGNNEADFPNLIYSLLLVPLLYSFKKKSRRKSP